MKGEVRSDLLYPRGAADRIRVALEDTPVVLVNGPRQCGKTTLARTLLQTDRPYFTLNDETSLLSAKTDSVRFVRQIDTAIIDGVQRAPELLRAIKQAVDNDRRPGRFLLTGSANILALPTISDSLAGRMEVVTLLPLAQSEIRPVELPRFGFCRNGHSPSQSNGRKRPDGASAHRRIS